jgi:hypothetical protein
MKTNPFLFAFTQFTSADRPLTLLIFFAATEITRADPIQIVKLSPLVTAPPLIIVTFYLTRELTSNEKISLISLFLTAMSFQTVIGIYSRFYANWVGLILGYLSFIFLLKSRKHPTKLKLTALVIAMITVLFIHVYTWIIIISVALVFSVVLHALRYYPRKTFLLIYIILFSSIALDVLKMKIRYYSRCIY